MFVRNITKGHSSLNHNNKMPFLYKNALCVSDNAISVNCGPNDITQKGCQDIGNMILLKWPFYSEIG